MRMKVRNDLMIGDEAKGNWKGGTSDGINGKVKKTK